METMPFNGLFEMVWWGLGISIWILVFWFTISLIRAWMSIAAAIDNMLDIFR